MRLFSILLISVIASLQYSLWLGKGSWLKVWEVAQQIDTQKELNQRLRTRNTSLDAEVLDLKQGYDAIEERARNELGMIKQNEIFFQILDHPVGPAKQWYGATEMQ